MADVKKNVNDEYEVAVKDIRPWMVVGTDKLKGLMFAMCSTEGKAKKAKELIDENLGGINMCIVTLQSMSLQLEALISCFNIKKAWYFFQAFYFLAYYIYITYIL